MTATVTRLFLALALAIALGGCLHRADYGSGECTEYTPWCLFGEEVCDIDARGCEVCTCIGDC